MAQDGDTITYTYTDGTSTAEDISTISEIKIDYIDGGGGGSYDSSVTGGDGGRVEGVVADVSGYSNIYIWVGKNDGRYFSSAPQSVPIIDGWNPGDGAASSEVSVSDTDYYDSETEPFIAAAGGGGGAGGSSGEGGGYSGVRGDGSDSSKGQSPPLGGAGGAEESDGGDAEGAVSGHGSAVPIVDSGTTITGGGTAANTNGDGSHTAGEIQITYVSSGGLSPPDPPSNLNTEVQ